MAVQLEGKRSDWRRIPEKLREKIRKEGVDLLTTLHGSIEEAAGVPMPLIRIQPWGWVGPQGQVLYGRTVLLPQADGSYMWGVELPASDIIVVDEIRLLRKILVHEFNHCFAFCTLTILGHDDLSLGDSSLTASQAFEKAWKTDNQFHVDPINWFGEDDAQEFLWYDSPDQGITTLSVTSNTFYERWIKKGLPIQTPDLRSSVSGEISIPNEVVNRVKAKEEKLKLPNWSEKFRSGG